MPAESKLAEAMPVFTECLSHSEGQTRPSNSRALAARLQELLEQIQSQPNPAARVVLQECLESLLAFYGEGLSHILGHIGQADGSGEEILRRLLADPAVSALLLIHGLHPVPLEKRLRDALEKVRPYLQSHGGNIELLHLESEVAHVKLQGTCQTCPSSAVTLELAVRRAVEQACPDLVGFEVVGPKRADAA